MRREWGCVRTFDVKQCTPKNKFWMHEVRITKKEQGLSSSGDINPQQEYNKTLALDSIIPQKTDLLTGNEKNLNQDRLSDEESFSNRSILDNALASTVQNEVEQKKLDGYRSRIAMLDAEEAKLGKLKSEIKELTFGEKRDPARLKEIKEEARKTEARIDLHDKKLL